jgi:hypothetical protein
LAFSGYIFFIEFQGDQGYYFLSKARGRLPVNSSVPLDENSSCKNELK